MAERRQEKQEGKRVVKQEERVGLRLLTQRPEPHGPPMYYTPDWTAARASVERLAALEPEHVVAGHEPAMRGAAMRSALRTLTQEFDRVAVPE